MITKYKSLNGLLIKDLESRYLDFQLIKIMSNFEYLIKVSDKLSNLIFFFFSNKKLLNCAEIKAIWPWLKYNYQVSPDTFRRRLPVVPHCKEQSD